MISLFISFFVVFKILMTPDFTVFKFIFVLLGGYLIWFA
ncbi:putative membrane protein [Escherichia coli 2-156-04_S3_C1]|nr:putative membrane protein [Escherichia coli 2-156-04_S3_C1]